MHGPKIGLLPLYLELYDTSMPHCRDRVEVFRRQIVKALEERGLNVLEWPICRVKAEFEQAVTQFDKERVEAIVTLHLAYSPSLESIDALTATRTPLIVLDTTPSPGFGPNQDPDDIMHNHGIHGVQDMCNLLRRRGRTFTIVAGHWRNSDVLDRTVAVARAAACAALLRRARVGLLGEPFKGMGDFQVPFDELKDTLGMEVLQVDPHAISGFVPGKDDPNVVAELALDAARFDTSGLDPQVHNRSVRVGLAVRRWLDEECLSAFSANFLSVHARSGLQTVPFLEAGKAMARGTGYAGEGDVLTAGFVGALAHVFPETTFTEMFCPDWDGNTVFLSHMGEVNVDLLEGPPHLVEKPFPWTDALNPVVAVGRLKAGPAVLADLAPGPDGRFTLILSGVEMVDARHGDRFGDTVHGWFRPAQRVGRFLEAYSTAGGTHHAALVYGDHLDVLKAFGGMMFFETIVIS